MNAPFDTTVGDKQRCRDVLVKAVRDLIPDPKRALMLPSKNAHDANLFLKNWPDLKITGIERDVGVFESLRANYSLFELIRGDVTGYVRRYAPTMRNHRAEIAANRLHVPDSPFFDVAFIDYMGMVKRQDVFDICEIVSAMGAAKMILGLTFVKNTRGHKQAFHFVREHAWLEEAALDDIEELDDRATLWNNPVDIANGICHAIETGYSGSVAVKVRRLDIVDAFTYRAEDKSSDMHFMALYIERS
jgi:hypothetical protein